MQDGDPFFEQRSGRAPILTLQWASVWPMLLVRKFITSAVKLRMASSLIEQPAAFQMASSVCFFTYFEYNLFLRILISTKTSNLKERKNGNATHVLAFCISGLSRVLFTSVGFKPEGFWLLYWTLKPRFWDRWGKGHQLQLENLWVIKQFCFDDHFTSTYQSPLLLLSRTGKILYHTSTSLGLSFFFLTCQFPHN